MTGTGIKVSDKSFNDEESSQKPGECKGSKYDDWERSEDPNLSLPPGECFVVIIIAGCRVSFPYNGVKFNSSLLDPERATAAPSHGQLALPYPPPFDHSNAP